VSNAPSKPVSFSRPKVGYFSNRPRILFIFHYIILRLAKQSQFNPYPENVENIVTS